MLEEIKKELINNLQQESGHLAGISGFASIDDCKNR